MQAKVISCKAAKNGGFTTRLSIGSEINHPVLGKISNVKTYFIKTSTEITVDTSFDIDMTQFKTRTSTDVDDNGKELSFTWLEIK